MMVTAIDNLATKHRERAAAAQQAYKQLILDSASGNAPSEAAMQKILDAAGVDVFALAAEVATVTHRREKQAELAKLEAEAESIAGLQAKIDATEAEFQLARQAAAAIIQPLQNEIHTIRMGLAHIQTIKSELRNGCADQSIIDRECAINQQLVQNGRQTNDARDRLQKAEATFEHREVDKERADEARARIARAKSDIERLAQEQTELLAEREKIELARIST